MLDKNYKLSELEKVTHNNINQKINNLLVNTIT